ncbi:perforin-1-like [Entelurus aequoreus]|uniref:perforin-1-like n=1 Tax=Entelurus aequoreus TaxID=161455 RepID=UPI002B1CE7B5|nr:perforin-1-like [Entelurus aequoreus]
MNLLNICAVLMLSFSQRTHQSCTVGTPKQCLQAELAPGTNLAGEGFDITTMERKEAFVLDMDKWERKDKTCTLCINPFLKKAQQKLPLSVVDWRPKQVCRLKDASTLYRSSESLVNSMTSVVENNWKFGLNLNLKKFGANLMLAGTNSKLAEYSMQKTKTDKFSFVSQKMSCEYYSYRVSVEPKLHAEFQKALKKLPKTYSPSNKQHFYKLIETFGTHYVTKVKLGGSVQSTTSINQCQTSLQGLSTEEVQMCLEVEKSLTIKVTMDARYKHCKNDSDKTESKKNFSSLFNDRLTNIRGGHTNNVDLLFSAGKDPSAYKQWLNTLPRYPDIISYSLESLHELVPTPERKNLQTAISHYILERGLMINCSGRCQAGIKGNSRESCVCQCHNVPAVNQDCCPSRRGMARVIITVQRASGLWGDHSSATDGYVKVIFNKREYRSPVILNNNNPHWATIVDLGSQDLSTASTVRFQVWDQDSGWDDDLLGQCERILKAGVDQDVCAMHHGQLFFKWDVKCAPNLGSESCMDYKSSPMSQSLRNMYVSRHAHPIPRDIMLEMGVFVNNRSAMTN